LLASFAGNTSERLNRSSKYAQLLRKTKALEYLILLQPAQPLYVKTVLPLLGHCLSAK